MSKTGWILLWLLMTGCVTMDIPDPYQFKPSEIQNNPYGCWMEVTVASQADSLNLQTHSGELLTIDKDSLFLLNYMNIVKTFDVNTVKSAVLYTHKNTGNNYIMISGILAIPGILGAIAYTEYAGPFLLLMALPVSLIGIVEAFIQQSVKGNELMYPQKNTLADFKVYSRYPAGLPENINLQNLEPKKY